MREHDGIVTEGFRVFTGTVTAGRRDLLWLGLWGCSYVLAAVSKKWMKKNEGIERKEEK